MLNKTPNFGLILSNTERSIDYLVFLKRIKLKPGIIIVYSKEKIHSKFKKLLIGNNYLKFLTNDINNKKVVDSILKLSQKYLIYSGYPSKIIKNKTLLEKKILLHSHTGKIPYFKGSTTIFYSILKNKSIWCSTFRMSHKIDSGTLYYLKKYKINKKIFINYNKSDNLIRIKNLIKVLKDNFRKRKIINKKKYEEYYYVAHPIIRCLAKLNVKK